MDKKDDNSPSNLWNRRSKYVTHNCLHEVELHTDRVHFTAARPFPSP